MTGLLTNFEKNIIPSEQFLVFHIRNAHMRRHLKTQFDAKQSSVLVLFEVS